MKRIFTCIWIGLLAVTAQAVSVNDVTGMFRGNLNIGGTNYANEEVYILPGTESNSITFVLPNVASWGRIVLVNIPMDASGKLSVNDNIYIQTRSERATFVSSTSVLSASNAQLNLSVSTPTETNISFAFNGNRVTDKNYAITNGGFEGNWSGNEPTGWHSFVSASGVFASFLTNPENQFTQQSDVRPGSTGSHSAQIKSTVTLSVKANGNCTNGQINAGSTSADDAKGNYSYSDPSNTGYNTPFVGNPDSLVFWAKYIPGGGSIEDANNKARAHAVLTTNARYQDPESNDYSSVKVAEATVNYSAISGNGWQRITVPFVYYSLDPSKTAYMLLTFSTNQTAGGGNSTKKSPDYVYLDDAEMIYNHSLTSLKLDGAAVSFTSGQATTNKMFSDQDYTFAATTNGKASKSFIGYDAKNNQVHVYVVAQNYSQAKSYSLYTLQMAEPIKDTEYAYSATTCDNEPYSDNLFSNLTEAGTYHTTIPNTRGGDSLITLTLNVLPTYSFSTTATIRMDESYSWQGREYNNLAPGVYKDTNALKTKAGCDSVFTLTLTVEAIPYAFSETITACKNEETTWHNKSLPTGQVGTTVIYDSLLSIYDKDSVYTLTLNVLPTYRFEETKYVNEADLVWHGKTIQGLPQSSDPYLFYDSLTATNGCDSVYVLTLHVSDIPVTYGYYEAATCHGEEVEFEGVKYGEAFHGEVRASELNIYGGDSIVNLTVTILPIYYIEDLLTIKEGDAAEWEYYNLSHFTAGDYTLEATYYSIDDCDSTMVLNLKVLSDSIATRLPNTQETGKVARKIFRNGQLYIIRKEDAIYDTLGKRIK